MSCTGWSVFEQPAKRRRASIGEDPMMNRPPVVVENTSGSNEIDHAGGIVQSHGRRREGVLLDEEDTSDPGTLDDLLIELIQRDRALLLAKANVPEREERCRLGRKAIDDLEKHITGSENGDPLAQIPVGDEAASELVELRMARNNTARPSKLPNIEHEIDEPDRRKLLDRLDRKQVQPDTTLPDHLKDIFETICRWSG
ncbi:hypothetical protein LTR08_007187 [Meristemomyces frigidus]|nr:hypothetical protein LTR08_007187 [Meristemomyces frigidus]